jgi:endonuclease/exonuclease/phosphatase (EEP) superfamily protein YafD
MRLLYILWLVSDDSRGAVLSVMKEIRKAVVKVADRVTMTELYEHWHRHQLANAHCPGFRHVVYETLARLR